MTERELLKKLRSISNLTDFKLLFRHSFNDENWGEYFYSDKYIVLYVLDEGGKHYDEETLMRVALHELAHHVQYYHIKGYYPKEGEEHDAVFKKEFAKLLGIYYNGVVPKSTLEFIKGEGYLYEPTRKKKRIRKRVEQLHG